MKKILLLFLYFPFISFSQEKIDKEFSAETTLLQGKKYIIDSIIGDPGINIQKVYIDGLARKNWNEVTSLYYNGDNKEGVVLGFYSGVSNEYGLSYSQNIFKNMNRDESIKVFRTVDLIKDRDKDYLSESRKENHIYFKIGDIRFLLFLDEGYQIIVFWNEYVSYWGGPSFEKMRRKFEKRLRQSNKGKIND